MIHPSADNGETHELIEIPRRSPNPFSSFIRFVSRIFPAAGNRLWGLCGHNGKASDRDPAKAPDGSNHTSDSSSSPPNDTAPHIDHCWFRCPVCGCNFELPGSPDAKSVACPHCLLTLGEEHSDEEIAAALSEMRERDERQELFAVYLKQANTEMPLPEKRADERFNDYWQRIQPELQRNQERAFELADAEMARRRTESTPTLWHVPEDIA